MTDRPTTDPRPRTDQGRPRKRKHGCAQGNPFSLSEVRGHPLGGWGLRRCICIDINIQCVVFFGTGEAEESFFLGFFPWVVSFGLCDGYNKMQYSTIQYNAIPYHTTRYNTLRYNTGQYIVVQYNTTLYITTPYNTNTIPHDPKRCNTTDTISYTTTQ